MAKTHDTAKVPIAHVERRWPDSLIVCIASGPSLTQDDVNLCRGKARVIAVNDAYRLAPWADVLYAADLAWWKAHDYVQWFTGTKYTITSSSETPDLSGREGLVANNIQILRHRGVRGLASDGLCTGLNSGYQAINLAVLLGAKTIVLLGYDMQSDPDGKVHWFGKHKSGLNNASNYPMFARQYQYLVEPLKAHGVDVVNCSRRTALTWFKRASLEDLVLRAEVAA
jgi:hypothetical protein